MCSYVLFKQVPLLLSMGEDERALQRAITSGDCDLVTLALLHIERSSYTNNSTNNTNTTNTSSSGKGSSGSVRDQDAVYKLVHTYPEALSLLKVSQQQHVRVCLLDISELYCACLLCEI
jgi:Vps16, C-terminal region